MKKLLKVSLMAMLVAAPFAANATLPAAYSDGSTTTKPTLTAAADVASTSYVKGAYDAAIGYINELNTAKQDQLTNGSANVSATVKTSVGAASGEGAATDTSLVTEKAVRDAIDNSNSAMDTRVGALETTVGNSTNGLVKDVAGLQTTVGDSTNGLVKDVAGLQTTVGDSSSGLVKDVADLKSAGYITKDVNDLTNYTTTTDMETALDAKQDASKSTVANGTYNYIVQGDGVATNLVNLDTATKNAKDAADTAESHIGTLSGLSTTAKTDVVSAINEVAATAAAAKRVTVHTTWNSDSTTAPADVLVNAN